MGAGRPPIGRITRRPDYLAAATGRRFHTGRMTAQGRPRRAEEPATGLRFGFTVTKKTGHATERNRIRRRLKAAAAEIGPEHAERALDLVLIGRREALGAPFEVLVNDIRRALATVTKPKPAGQPGRPRREAAPPEPQP
ncbi:ribonuclease P protein component [Methylobacterium sp. 4-46]|uniref:ribonuclease P protein component n=1 Tax=unclassified Methylobacterium TaxID=2615210 RepID=UPI000152CE7E|nr:MULTISPECIES: ribonuclease P protein component [Methylobacterium]ACA19406.1 ribonuclease P protein component [Methylobacterium sp. 4-46]WFT78604.1 ribonuclease P protein component [Methylobacterium nodulans]